MTIEESKSLIEETDRLNPDPIIELFELDLRPVGDDAILYFHNGKGGFRDAVAFRGVNYEPLPIEVRGFDHSVGGEPQRPTLSLMNLNGFVSAAILSTNDLVGAVVVRRRTFAKYLDSPTNTSSFRPEYPPDIFTIEQKLRENRMYVEFELGSGFDLDGQRFPARRVSANYCGFSYRNTGCGFGGRVAIANLNNRFYSGGQNYRGIWKEADVYYNNDCVEFERDGYWKVFECSHLPGQPAISGADMSPATNPSKWIERQRWRGTHDSGVTYLANDVVTRSVPVYGISRVAPKETVIIVAKAKSSLAEATPAPPNALYWDVDHCAKNQIACRYRFDGKFGNAVLPFGGFPGTAHMPLDL